MPEAIATRIKEGYTKQQSHPSRHRSIRRHGNVGISRADERARENGQINRMGQAEPKIGRGYVWKENIVRFTLHMDERTPHIHWVFVPITEDGRLSAKEILSRKIYPWHRTDTGNDEAFWL